MKITNIGLIVALSDEHSSLTSYLGEYIKDISVGNLTAKHYSSKNTNVYLIESGVGEIYATIATTALIVNFNVDLILNFGLVGALKPSFAFKDVVLVDSIVHYDFYPMLSDENTRGQYWNCTESIRKTNIDSIRQNLNILHELPTARIASGDKFIDVKEFKYNIVKQFDCDICDMESMGIYITCHTFNIPFILIKAVSDNADENSMCDFSQALEIGVDYYLNAVKSLLDSLNS